MQARKAGIDGADMPGEETVEAPECLNQRADCQDPGKKLTESTGLPSCILSVEWKRAKIVACLPDTRKTVGLVAFVLATGMSQARAATGTRTAVINLSQMISIVTREEIE